jgi:hypothetical protein
MATFSYRPDTATTDFLVAFVPRASYRELSTVR